jgi:outer membrane protein assembly factor BamE (lipoprotein component of BamABCDE complex)
MITTGTSMNIITQFAFILFASFLLAGCESPGRSLAKSAVDQIRDGQTTQAEVDRIFGEPMQITRSPDGRTLYLYQRFYGPDRYNPSLPPRRDESNLQLLSVLFNPAGVVQKHLYSHTQPNIDRIQLTTGRKLGSEDLGRITPGKTTRAELATWFGSHWSEELTLSGHRLISWLYADAYNVGGRVEVQALEVVLDDTGIVQTFRVTKRDPWRN